MGKRQNMPKGRNEGAKLVTEGAALLLQGRLHSNYGTLSKLKSILDIHAEIPDGVFDLRVTK